MLEFHPLTAADIPVLQKYMKIFPWYSSDISIGFLLMNAEEYEIYLTEYNDTLILQETWGDDPMYLYPFGKDPEGAMQAIREYVTATHEQLVFYAAENELWDALPKEQERIRGGYDPRWSDYLYNFDDIMTFTGKRYKGQRNHINKFHQLYGQEDVQELRTEDLPEVRAFLEVYGQEHPDKGLLEERELKHTQILLDILPHPAFPSYVIRHDGKIIGLSITEIRHDTLIIHVEKALTAYEGVYPVLFHAVVNKIAESQAERPLYINREDDSGDPGLHTSKTQYHPLRMVNKYFVHYDSPLYGAGDQPVLKSDRLVLTTIRESDSQAYYDLNTDEENNKYWGYDYREDENLPYPLETSSFWLMQVQDYLFGENCSFAVRTAEDGEMIGELVLYRFMYTGEVEIGCRITPACQGHGYGSEAFKLGVDYVRNVWKRIPTARCYKENIRSRKMIEASGLKLYKEDDTFLYYR